jgi:tripartite-type tricarboxylate transporter receptor subunit TctC
MTHVPYKGGGPLGTAIISGEVVTTIGTIGSFFPYIKSGQMRPLGVTSAKRVDRFPDIPAIAETLPGFEFTAWVGSFVPAGTPRSIVDRLNAKIKKALDDTEVVKLLSERVLDPMYMTPEQFAGRLRSDYDRYGTLMKSIGVI